MGRKKKTVESKIVKEWVYLVNPKAMNQILKVLGDLFESAEDKGPVRDMLAIMKNAPLTELSFRTEGQPASA